MNTITSKSTGKRRIAGALTAAAIGVTLPIAAIATASEASASNSTSPGLHLQIGGQIGIGNGGLQVNASGGADAGSGDDTGDSTGSTCDSATTDPSQDPTSSSDPTDGASTAPDTTSDTTSDNGDDSGSDCAPDDSHDNSRAALVHAVISTAKAKIKVKAGAKAKITVNVATASGRALATGKAVLVEGKKQVAKAAVVAGKVVFTATTLAKGTHHLAVGLVTDTGSLVKTQAGLTVSVK